MPGPEPIQDVTMAQAQEGLGGVSITPADGGFIIAWDCFALETAENVSATINLGARTHRRLIHRTAVRENLDAAMSLVANVLTGERIIDRRNPNDELPA